MHDFSRLDNKGLLSNTIDAVGDTGLKENSVVKEYFCVILKG